MSNYSVTLSTTEPNNYVGLIKLRQGDVASQSIQATITANGQLFKFDGLSVFFNAVLPNGNVIRDKVTEVDYVNSKLNYVVADSFLQEVAQVTAWFSFENGEKIIDSTKNFQYSVIGGWKECIPQGNYIYELSEIQREIEEIIKNKDFTSLISKISSLETDVNNQSQKLKFFESTSNSRLLSAEQQLTQKANKDEVTNVLTPKGNSLYANLPKVGNSVGDYYYCSDGNGTAGKGNYVWNGSTWYFGGTGDDGYNILKSDLNIIKADIRTNIFNPLISTQTLNGITINNNGDGTYTLTGTATAKTNFHIYNEKWHSMRLGVGTYKLVGCPSGGSLSTYYLEIALKNANDTVIFDKSDQGSGQLIDFTQNVEYIYCAISIELGTTINGLVFKPMLTNDIDVTYNDFVRYTGDRFSLGKNVSDVLERMAETEEEVSKLSELSEWKSAIENETTFNLFQPTLRSTSLNGLSLVYNGDGTYTIDGTATKTTNFYLLGSNWTSKTMKAGTYRFVGNPPGGLNSKYYIEVALKNASGNSIYDKIDMGSGLNIIIEEDATSVYFAITVIAGNTVNSLTFKPMLTENLAATYDNYVKYTGTYGTINKSIAKLNDDISALENNTVYWDVDIKPPYWTLHLDCARKYVTVSNVLVIIDKISEAGFNQLQLHFSDDSGFRLQLNDMSVTDEDGITYDLTPCLGGAEMPTSWYSQSDMDTIISYARGKGIDVVPSFDMPGHMQWILTHFPAFRYETSNTLNIMNITAVKFAKAISDKYSKYFSSRGCHFWNIGYDEIANSNGFATFYNGGNYNKVISFANEIIEVVQGNGLTPRIFNEVVYYNSDYSYLFEKDVEVYHWYSPAPCATAKQLQYAGYKLINTNTSWYWVLNRTDMQVSADTLKNADLLKGYHDSTTDHNGYGAMFCVWCDRPTGYSDEGDGGNALVISITPLIAAFGIAIKNATT